MEAIFSNEEEGERKESGEDTSNELWTTSNLVFNHRTTVKGIL